jgi:hypothetical protein
MKLEKELSQLDPGGVLKSAHQDQNNSLRITSANTSVPPKYARVALTYNGSGSVTNAIFYEGSQSEIRYITTVADSSGSLNNSYFILYSGYDRAKYHVWYDVNGAGVDPAPANSLGFRVPLQSNDSAEMVALATKLVLSNLSDFNIVAIGSTQLRITNTEMGTATDTTQVSTGFTYLTAQQGSERIITSVVVPQDAYSKYLFNTQERRFEVVPVSSSTIEVDLTHVTDSVRLGDGTQLNTNTYSQDLSKIALDTVNLAKPFTKPWNAVRIEAKNDDGDPIQIITSFGGVDVQQADITYDVDGDFESLEVTDI